MLRLAFAGAGGVVADRHLPALARVPEIRVVAVADLDAERARAAAALAGGARVHSTLDALLEPGLADAVAICLPPRLHEEIAVAAARAGLHVLVEKPLSRTAAGAAAIAAAAAEAGVAGATGFNLRCHRLVRRARDLLCAGALGEVVAARTVFSDPLLDGAVPAWRLRRSEGGGALWDKAVHHVDLLRHLLDDELEQPAVAVRREPGADDAVALLTARTRGGALVEILAADRGPVRQELLLIGTRASLELDLYRSDGLRHVPPHELPGAPAARLRRTVRLLPALPQLVVDARRGGVFRDGYAVLWRAFAAHVRGEETPLATLADGVRAVELLEAAAPAARPAEAVAAVA